jgi:hypothetical protein
MLSMLANTVCTAYHAVAAVPAAVRYQEEGHAAGKVVVPV